MGVLNGALYLFLCLLPPAHPPPVAELEIGAGRAIYSSIYVVLPFLLLQVKFESVQG